MRSFFTGVIIINNTTNNIKDGVNNMEKSYAKSQSNFIGRTLLTMSAGMFVTFVIAYITSTYLINLISFPLIIAAMIGEVVLVIYLSSRISRMSTASARFWFYVYAALNGFTLSMIFTAYSISVLSTVFLLTSGMFFASAMIGITTKIDLSGLGQFFMMLLIGIIILSLVQFFFQGLNFFIALAGIVVFSGLTAYDMQKIKRFHDQSNQFSQVDASRFVIIAALSLYLDFINLFLFVLRLFNDNK